MTEDKREAEMRRVAAPAPAQARQARQWREEAELRAAQLSDARDEIARLRAEVAALRRLGTYAYHDRDGCADERILVELEDGGHVVDCACGWRQAERAARAAGSER